MLTHGMLTFHFLWKAGGMEERLAEWEGVRAEVVEGSVGNLEAVPGWG